MRRTRARGDRAVVARATPLEDRRGIATLAGAAWPTEPTHTRSRGAPRARHRARPRRLRREGLVPGVVYGGRHGDCRPFKVDARELRQVLVDGSALIDLKVDGKTRPVIVKDQQLAPGARRGHPHRPARGPPRREDPDARSRVARRGRRGGARRQGGRRARAGDATSSTSRRCPPPSPRRSSSTCRGWRSPRTHAPLRGHRARGRRVPRRPGGDDHRDGRRPDRGRGARGDRGGDRAGRRGRRADRGAEGEEGEEAAEARGAEAEPKARSPEPLPPRTAAAAGSTGWSSGSATRATATRARATTSASRSPRWPPSAGACRKAKKKYGGPATPTAAPAPAARASACCCRRPT